MCDLILLHVHVIRDCVFRSGESNIYMVIEYMVGRLNNMKNTLSRKAQLVEIEEDEDHTIIEECQIHMIDELKRMILARLEIDPTMKNIVK